MPTETLALNGNWLTSDTVQQTILTTTGCLTTANYYPSYIYPMYLNSPAAKPIRLTMSEVERLRKAARADEKLREVLAKFTDQIEVVVDFQ